MSDDGQPDLNEVLEWLEDHTGMMEKAAANAAHQGRYDEADRFMHVGRCSRQAYKWLEDLFNPVS